MRKVILFCLMTLVFSIMPVYATVINIPADQPTIQAGIINAVNGDTVLVSDGIYQEHIDFLGKAIVVKSNNGLENCVLTVAYSGIPAVYFHDNEDTTSRLEGFTIEGDSTYWGIHCENSSPYIYNNLIQNHELGIRCDNASPFIRKNEIRYCDHRDISPNNGGAIRLINASNTVIDSNSIHNNWANVVAGIMLDYCDNIRIERNLIYSNQSVYLCGVDLFDCNNIEFYNNTLLDNSGPDPYRGSVYIYNGSDITILNNIFANNNEYGIYHEGTTPNLIVDYNNFFNNNPDNTFGITPGSNSIYSNPEFVSDIPPIDLNLLVNSPCIDAGDPSSPFDPDGTISDMGAIYFNQSRSLWHISNTGNDTTGDGSEESPYATIQHGIDRSTNGDTVLVHPGIFIENINFIGKSILLSSLFLLAEDTTFIELTTIDGDESGSVVTFNSGEDTTAIISGFTLTNGINLYGGGISCVNSNPQIINNLIRNNNFGSSFIGLGGGIYCDNSSPLINNNCIDSNRCMWNGGGIYCANNSNPIISENIISYNSATEGGGGGIACHSSTPMINGNIISNNLANEGGGGIYCYQCNPIITNNTIANHYLWYGHGGGIWCSDATPILTNNYLINNNAHHGGGLSSNSDNINIVECAFIGNTCNINGGALYLTGVSNPEISNCTFVNNNSPSGGGAMYFADNVQMTISNSIIAFNDSAEAIFCADTLSVPTISCSNIYGNEFGDWTGYIADQANINGNFSLDPLFCNLNEGDYHLYDISPCLPENNECGTLIGANEQGCIGLLAFGLRSPQTGSILTNTPEHFFWQTATDSFESEEVSYIFIIAGNPNFELADSSISLNDTSYILSDTLSRSIQYYWKVLAFHESYPSRLSDETWNFYIDGYPTLPTILDPDNGDNVDDDTYLIWLISTDPDTMDLVTYSLQIDNNSDFSSPEIDVSGISNSGLLLDEALAQRLSDLTGIENLVVEETYYWRVKADDSFGLSSEFTDGTNYFIYGANVNDPPFPPTSGFSPAADEEIISLTPTITWDDATDPDPDDHSDNLIYYFHLIEDTSTGGFEYGDTTAPGINQVAIPVELPDNSHFMYFVKTVDDEGLESEWSEMQWFWTNHYNYPPEPFPLNTPEPDLRWVDYYTYFNWGGTVDYDPMASIEYTLQISPDSLFDNFVLTRSGITDTSKVMITDTLALAGGNLYWRIFASGDDSLIRYGGLPEPEVRKLAIFPPGDANTDGIIIGADVTYLVGYFRGLNPPPNPILAGDASGDCQVIGADVTYLVNYFRGLNPKPVRGDCAGTVIQGIINSQNSITE